MSKRKRPANAGPANPAAGNPAADQPQATDTQATAADGGAPTPATGGDGGADGAAGPETPAVNIDQDATRYFGGAAGGSMDPDGKPADMSVVPGGGQASDNEGDYVDPVLVALYAAEQLRNPIAVDRNCWDNEVLAFTVLAEFFRAFPDAPDEAGPVQLQRLKIDLPSEHRPGLLLAMIRVFRLALTQLDRLDAEDAATAKAAEPKPKPDLWRKPKGYAVQRKGLSPKTGLKVRD